MLKLQILMDHTDEVWFVAFSHSGAMLASASKDKSAIIWDVRPGQRRVAKRCVLLGHHEVSLGAFEMESQLNKSIYSLRESADEKAVKSFSLLLCKNISDARKHFCKASVKTCARQAVPEPLSGSAAL